MKKPFYKRVWFILPTVLFVLAAGVAITWSSTTVLQEAIIDFVCSGNAGVQPKDYDEVLSAIDTLGTDVSYESRFDLGVMDVYAKRSESLQPLVVYAHGGYYVSDDKEDFTYYCQKLASYGFVVANMNYALAPEGRYPTQILQVNEAVSYLLGHAEEYGVDPEKVFIAGDSAGGHLASQMGLYYTNADFRAAIGDEPAVTEERLRGVVLLCGYYHIDTLRETGFPLIADSVWMMTGEKHYEGTPTAERMNTVTQITADYPAVFLTCGDADPFITQAEEMLDVLEANGIDATAYLPTSGKTKLWHEFQRDLTTDEGVEAMEQTVLFFICALRILETHPGQTRIKQFLAGHPLVSLSPIRFPQPIPRGGQRAEENRPKPA
jgi:acetyl esterase/lipase